MKKEEKRNRAEDQTEVGSFIKFGGKSGSRIPEPRSQLQQQDRRGVEVDTQVTWLPGPTAPLCSLNKGKRKAPPWTMDHTQGLQGLPGMPLSDKCNYTTTAGSRGELLRSHGNFRQPGHQSWRPTKKIFPSGALWLVSQCCNSQWLGTTGTL